MTSPIDLAHRSRERVRGRRRVWLRRLVLVVVALAVVAVGLVGLAQSPVFSVRTVAVSGNKTVPAGQIRQAAAVPLNVPLARVDTAAIGWPADARISMPLIGTSSAWSSSRNALATTSAAKMTNASDHQCRPTSAATPSAMPTPHSTAATRTSAIFAELCADACMTSSAVSVPVMSGGPSRTTTVSR